MNVLHEAASVQVLIRFALRIAILGVFAAVGVAMASNQTAQWMR